LKEIVTAYKSLVCGFLCKSHPKVHQIDHEYIIRCWLKWQHLYNKGLSLAQRRCRKQWIC